MRIFLWFKGIIVKFLSLGLIALVLGLLGGSFLNSGVVRAASGNGAGFTIMPMYPKNQLGGETGSFSLLVKPSQIQEVTVRVVNQQDKKRTIRFGFNTAYTNSSGNISYDLGSKYLPKDSSRKISIADLVQSPQVQTVQVGPSQTGFLTFKLKMPSTQFNGVLLGAIFAMPVGEKNNTVTQSGTTLRNQFGMALPVTLKMDQNYKAPIKLRLNTIRPAIVNKSIGVQVNVQNVNPQFTYSDLNIHARISKKGSSKVLHSNSVTQSSFAPNSNYNYAISWGGKPLEPGKYHLSWKSDVGGVQNWNFERDFTITNAQAQNLNNQAGFKPSYLWLWILLGVLVLVLIIIVTYYVGRKRSRQNNQATNSSNTSRRSH